MKRTPAASLAMASCFYAVGVSQAELSIFTDRSAWESAVGQFQTEDFNSITTDTEIPADGLSFDALTISHEGSFNQPPLIDLLPYEYSPGSGDIDGSARVNIAGMFSGASMTIEFDTPVIAAGFDTVNYDVGDEEVEAFVGVTSIGSFPELRDQTGFIGVISTGELFESIVIRHTPGDNDTFNAFDNVSFVVPEPSTVLLGAFFAFAVGSRSRRSN
ncbi:MAG: hypothetical protein AAF266_15130 [Planctomycetota bacterium]